MQKNVYNVKVTKTPDIFRADMKVTQNDKDSNEVVVRIFNDDGSEIDYAQFSSASIIFTKPDYNVVESNLDRLTIASDGIRYLMGTNEIACTGIVTAQVILYGSNGERLTVGGFKFEVLKDPITPWSVESTSEYGFLEQFVQEVNEALQQVGPIHELVQSAYAVVDTLETDINTGNALHDTLTTDIQEANSVKEALDQSTINANNSKNALDGSIAEAGLAKTDLDNSIDDAAAVNDLLAGNIVTGNSLKSNLDERINTGNTLNSDLQTSIAQANTTKSALDTSINIANTTKTALDGSIATAEDLKDELDDIISGTDFEQIIIDIDNLKQDQHNHSNKEILDELTDEDGKLKYKGQYVGIGDMTKAEYDTDGDGKVDIANKAEDADALGGNSPEYYAKQTDLSSLQDSLNTHKADNTRHISPNIPATAITFGGKFQIAYNSATNSLDITVVG